MVNIQFTPDCIEFLNDDEIFVFGDNEAGRHGAGAALFALDFGAVWGKHDSLQGQTYGISTKDKYLKVLPLSKIKANIKKFIKVVQKNPNKKFYITKIGCGLAGYTPEDIAPLFNGYYNIPNLIFPEDFWAVMVDKLLNKYR
jgi:hypothetical protein